MDTLLASEIMTREVVTVRPETTLGELVNLLVEKNISAVPVTDPDGKVLGIVSESDLIDEERRKSRMPRLLMFGVFSIPEDVIDEALHHGERLTAADLMSTRVLTLPEATPAKTVAETMVSKKINHVPITRDGRLVGIIARTDVLRAMHHGWKRPDPADTPGSPEPGPDSSPTTGTR